MSVLHFIPHFTKGGAENILKKYLMSPDLKGNHAVVCLKNPTEVSLILEEHGIKIFYLNLSLKRIFNIFKIKKIINETKPNILQGWMYHSNFICLLVNIIYFKRFKVYWNIRRTYDRSSGTRLPTRILSKLLSYLSRFVSLSIYPSQEALDSHVKASYYSKNSIVIENGADENLFKPNLDTRKKFRALLHVEDHVFLIGYIARFHPIKGYADFIKACSLITPISKDIKFIMIGREFNKNNQALLNLLEESHVKEKTIILDEVINVNEYLTTMDLFVSSSYCEGFCNTLIEAMLTGVMAIATNAGNSKDIVLEYPKSLISPGDIKGLASAISTILDLSPEERAKIGCESRNKIVKKYSLKKMVHMYNNIYHRS